MAEEYVPIAISGDALEASGCPYCGYRSGTSPISGNGTSIVVCGECDQSYAVLAPGVFKSTMGFGDFYPELQVHPRSGIPSHGKPDKRPEGGGEFFHSRGIGLDSCTCFICGTKYRKEGGYNMLNNIAAFVQCKAAGERVVAMFAKGARLDYRPYEPDRVQVKIGACDEHLPNLELLDYFCSDGIIKPSRIDKAVTLKPRYTSQIKPTARRRGQVDTLSKILADNLQASVERRDGSSNYVKFPITVLTANNGWSRQLIFNDFVLVCELKQLKDQKTVELHLAKNLPFEPWHASLVVKLFKRAHGKEAVVPQGVIMPKITGSSIKPEEATSWREAGYELDIKFENAPFGAKAVEQQTNLISQAMNYELGSTDCCHFFTNSVCMFFPTKKAATNALARVQIICPK